MVKRIISGGSFNGTITDAEFREMKKDAEFYYASFLKALGYDIDNDPNMRETPKRVVKMFTEEICKGTYKKEPNIKVFENQQKYDGMVFSGGIDLKSVCSHHICFIKGKAYVAYVPGKTVIGLSKLNRVVDWFARRPQLQEQLTMQIHNYLKEKIRDCYGLAVLVEGEHTCVSMRGVEQESTMTTSKLSGCFLEPGNIIRTEFYEMIKNSKL